MNEINSTEMILDGEYEGVKNSKKWMPKVFLALVAIAMVTMLVLLTLGISPLGRYLQSVDWIRDFAKLFCN